MKYIVEGNINFYNELYKILDEEETTEQIPENVCLITNQKLTDNFVKMECGHSFNYIPLYYDIYNHKKKFNSMESNSGHLKINEIRCPYCRNKQTGVLPYYEDLGLEKINGVNMICETKQIPKIAVEYKKCEFVVENKKFNPELPESTINVNVYGPNLESFNSNVESFKSNMNVKWFHCSSYGTKMDVSQNYGDTKCYCSYHKKQVISKYKKEAKEKEKQVKQEAKLLEKQAKQEAKLLEKQAKQEAKMLEKQAKQAKQDIKTKTKIQQLTEEIDEENTVIKNSCNELLKTGVNKGHMCDQKIFQDGLCKRHYQIKNKSK